MTNTEESLMLPEPVVSSSVGALTLILHRPLSEFCAEIARSEIAQDLRSALRQVFDVPERAT